ncbi:GCN5-related N-acetyltransferase, partial [mine drainage metagenome]
EPVGGATVPDYRGRGLYTALLAVRLQEAKRRGARFLTIDAGPMSRPIVEKYGFRLLTFAQAHVRENGSRSQPQAP